MSPIDICSVDVPRTGRRLFCDREIPNEAVSEMSQTPRSTESPFSVAHLCAQTPQGSLSLGNYIISCIVLMGVWECSCTSPRPVMYGQAILSASKHCLLQLESACLGGVLRKSKCTNLTGIDLFQQSLVKGIFLAKTHTLSKLEPV